MADAQVQERRTAHRRRLDLVVGEHARNRLDEVRDRGGMGLDLIPETVIEEGVLWTLAVNRNQDLLGKTMVVLRRDCTSVVEITYREWVALRPLLRRVVPVLEALFQPDQFNFAFLMNLDAQVHLHVIPRYSRARQWHGEEFWDANWGSAFGHEQHLLEPRDLARLAGEIREALDATP